SPGAAPAGRSPQLDIPRTGPAGQQGHVHPAGTMNSRPAPRQAPGVVKVRLSGDRADIEATAAALAGSSEGLDRSGPRPNRYDPPDGVYPTVRPGPARPAGSSQRA